MGNIIAMGELVVEIMADEINQPLGEKGIWYGPYPSGAPAIMAAQAAKSGSSALVIGTVGNDDFGRNITARLNDLAMDTSAVRIDEDYTTGVAFVRYCNDGSRDFIYHIPHAAAGQIRLDQVKEEYFKKGGFFHITGSSLSVASVRKAVEIALGYCQKYDVKVSFDPNMRKELTAGDKRQKLMERILEQTYILLPSQGELEFITGLCDDQQAVQHVLEKNVEIVVLKKGAQGAELITNNQHFIAQSKPVDEVDPTGAGDIFAGMLLSSLNQGMSYAKSLRYAAAAGAYSVTRRGPMEGISSHDMLVEYLSCTA